MKYVCAFGYEMVNKRDVDIDKTMSLAGKEMYANKAKLKDTNERRIAANKDEDDFPDKLESWSDLLHPDDKNAVLKEFRDTINDYSGHKNYDVEYRLRVRSGECSLTLPTGWE